MVAPDVAADDDDKDDNDGGGWRREIAIKPHTKFILYYSQYAT